MKKLSVLLLASLLILTFAGCGSSGGSDDENTDDATWPVEYYMSVGGSPAPLMKAAPTTGTYKYLYFNKNNTYESGDLNNGTLTKTGEGTYSGGDPHNNVTLSLTGSWDNVDNALSGENVTISSGSLTIKGNTFAKDGSNTTPTPTVTWPVNYRGDVDVDVYGVISFNEDQTVSCSTYLLENDNLLSITNGTWSGDDPHNDGTVHLILSALGLDDDVVISNGKFDAGGLIVTRQ